MFLYLPFYDPERGCYCYMEVEGVRMPQGSVLEGAPTINSRSCASVPPPRLQGRPAQDDERGRAEPLARSKVDRDLMKKRGDRRLPQPTKATK